MPNDELPQLRAQIAALAARMVAQDGAAYAVAKRKAASQLLGDQAPAANVLPDNAEVEEQVRRYQALFLGQRQPARLRQLRLVALQVMEALAQFKPYLTGPVLSGSAGEHDDIHLQLFADSAKEVQIFLLGKSIALDMSETPHFKGARFDPVETASFLWHQEGVHAELYELHDLRGALKLRADGRVQRADSDAVRALIEHTEPTEHTEHTDQEHPPQEPA
jgi:hypothetical protein